MAKQTKRCETTGVPKALLRKAVASWTKARESEDLPLDRQPKRLPIMRAVGGYVAMLPPPPLPGTAEYYRCMSRWYQCYMQAQYLDGYYRQIAQLQQQMATGELLLTAYLESYATCLGGAPA